VSRASSATKEDERERAEKGKRFHSLFNVISVAVVERIGAWFRPHEALVAGGGLGCTY
jgi:hypothetical protein